MHRRLIKNQEIPKLKQGNSSVLPEEFLINAAAPCENNCSKGVKCSSSMKDSQTDFQDISQEVYEKAFGKYFLKSSENISLNTDYYPYLNCKSVLRRDDGVSTPPVFTIQEATLFSFCIFASLPCKISWQIWHYKNLFLNEKEQRFLYDEKISWQLVGKQQFLAGFYAFFAGRSPAVVDDHFKKARFAFGVTHGLERKNVLDRSGISPFDLGSQWRETVDVTPPIPSEWGDESHPLLIGRKYINVGSVIVNNLYCSLFMRIPYRKIKQSMR